jgi:peptide/nickel transport system substrate-binding protein
VSQVFNFVYNSAMIGGAQFPRYRNASVDKLIGQAGCTIDREARAALYQQAQRIVFDEMPPVVLFQLGWQRDIGSDIEGVNDNFSQPTSCTFERRRRVGPRLTAR